MPLRPTIAASTPVGVRDVTPELAAEFYDLEAKLTGCFQQFGYQRVLTPAFEIAHVLERGLGPDEAARLLKFVDPQTGDVLALRSDITPQIARLVSGPMAHEEPPLRLSYFGRVFRLRQHHEFQRREVAQAGVELIGPCESDADLEVLTLCCNSLVSAGSANYTLSLGHVGCLEIALAELNLSDDDVGYLKMLLRRKDRKSVDDLVGAGSVASELCVMYGAPEKVLAQAHRLGGKLAKPLERIEAILGGLGQFSDQCILDLGEIQGFGYYTGFVFHAYVPGFGEAVASGGRYDNLLARYGRGLPAAGFAIDEEGLTCRR